MANEDKATRYHRLRRRATLLAGALPACLLLGVVVSGGSAWLRDLFSPATVASGAGAAVLHTLSLGALLLAVRLPLIWYRDVRLEGRYRPAARPAGRWLVESAWSGAMGLGLAAAAAPAVLALVRWSPAYWWLAAAIVLGLGLLALAYVLPRATPRHELASIGRAALAARLEALADRADVRVSGICMTSGPGVAQAGARIGFGRQPAILLSERLLTDYRDEEVEVVVAHELAHHRHGDLWSALALEVVLLFAACAAAAGVLRSFSSSFGLTGPGDVAGLPLVVLGGGTAWVLLSPIAHAWSRYHERRADRAALQLTGNLDAFIRTLTRMTGDRLAEERPPRLVEWCWLSHPSPGARLDDARAWAAAGGRRDAQRGGSIRKPDARPPGADHRRQR